jgi:excisionase family DNA binding protein
VTDRDTERLVDAPTLAAITNLTVATVYRLTRQHDLPAYVFGRQYRYSVSEVLAAIRKPERRDSR